MQFVRVGHGNSLPEIGGRFFLKTSLTRKGRVAFAPTNLTHSGNTFMVYYSVRSSAQIPVPFQIGQVWEVEAIRLRRLRGSKESTQSFPTLVRLDLYHSYALFHGRFDPRNKTWRVFRLTDRGTLLLYEAAALVRYQFYAVMHTSGGKQYLTAGYFPEIVDASSGNIILRYSQGQDRTLSDVKAKEGNIPLLPDDGVPQTRETNVTQVVEFIDLE